MDELERDAARHRFHNRQPQLARQIVEGTLHAPASSVWVAEGGA